MAIRAEVDADRDSIHAVNTAAFETSGEADLVDALRAKAVPLISLVAEIDGAITGHILFSPVSLAEHPDLNLMGLGPMAVLPQRQRQGVGSALVREGLKRCKQQRCDAVVVVGHPEYYPRFGFVPASRYGVRCEYDVPDDVFMLVELKAGALRGASGLARYDEAFANV
ncbi:MAG TPA: N-acetyltransferase [Gammaproteobacteria bacterium]|jgi:putative acetyltransferase